MSATAIAASSAKRKRRTRQDADLPAFERRMNDVRAQEAYDQLRLNAAREGVDANDSEVEEDVGSYVPPVLDRGLERSADTAHDLKSRHMAHARAQALAAMRAAPKHKERPDFERIAAEVEVWNGQRVVGSSPAPQGGPGRLKRHATDRDEAADVELSQHQLNEAEDEEEGVGGPRILQTPAYLRGTLRGYQVEGVNWLLSLYHRNINGILADEMGLGKTFQTIAMLAFVRFSLHLPGPYLVVVPKSVLGNWYREFKKWAPDFKVFKFHGTNAQRPDLIKAFLQPPLKFDVVITTYDMITREPGAVKKISWKYLVVDEAHKLKNNESTTFQLMRQLPAAHRLLITGTPLQNDLKELWALLNFLAPTLFDDGSIFQQWFDARTGTAEESSVASLHTVIGPLMLRRLKADVATGIPPKREIYVSCGVAPKQRSTYLSVLTREAEALNKGAGGLVALQNIVMQLRKACNHPYLFQGMDPTGGARTTEELVTDSGKMVILDKLLAKLFGDREAKNKVLLFCQMTRMMDIIEDYLVFRGYQYCRLDGNTSGLDRDLQMAEFNNPDSPKFIFILSTRAGGLGINLQAANHVVLYDSDWNPQMDLQAQDRAHRIGQKRSVQIYRFVTDGTMEERIYTRALKKLYLDAMVVQQGRLQQAKDKASKDELMSMVRFGASDMFKTAAAEVTDADIDALIAAGEKKMDDMTSKTIKSQQQSLATFQLGVEETNIYEFEGVKHRRDASRMLHVQLPTPKSEPELRAIFSVHGDVTKVVVHPDLTSALVTLRTQAEATVALQRCGLECAYTAKETETIVTGDMIDEHWDATGEQLGRGKRQRVDYLAELEEEMAAVEEKKRAAPKIPPPKIPKRPTFRWHQLVNERRVRELHEELTATMIRIWRRKCERAEASRTPAESMSTTASPILPEGTTARLEGDEPADAAAAAAEQQDRDDEARLVAIGAEQAELTRGGFLDWTWGDFNAFRGAAVALGSVDDAVALAQHMGGIKEVEEVRRYAQAFARRGPGLVPNYGKIEEAMKRVQQRKADAQGRVQACKTKVEQCEGDAAEQLRFAVRSTDPAFDRQLFLKAYDQGMQAAGLGDHMRSLPEYHFDAVMQTRQDDFFDRRLQQLVRSCVQEAKGGDKPDTRRLKRSRDDPSPAPADADPPQQS